MGRLAFDKFRRHDDVGPDEKWQVAVIGKLVELFGPSDGWDGYCGCPVKLDAGMFAVTVLSQVMLPRTPLPRMSRPLLVAFNSNGTRGA